MTIERLLSMRIGQKHSIKLIAAQSPDVLAYTIDSRHKTETFAFLDGIRPFQSCCVRYYGNNRAPLWNNADFRRLNDIFAVFPNNSRVVIETNDFQYIPFEALHTQDKSGNQIYLGARCRISRKAAGDAFLGGFFKKTGAVCLLQCFALERHQLFTERLTGIFQQYYGISIELQTINTLDDLMEYLKADEYAVIHIIAHIEDDMIAGDTPDERIPLESIKKALENPGVVHSGIIVLTCCGALNFFSPGDEKLFSPFIRQAEVKALVGMCRTIYADRELSYLDAFYHCLLSGKTAAEAVQCAIYRNIGVSSPKEDDPLPMVHFGNPECRFKKPYLRRETGGHTTKKLKKLITAGAAAAVTALLIVVALWQTRPRIENVRIEGLSLAGRAVWIGRAGDGREFVVAAAARMEDGSIIYAEAPRTVDLPSSNSFLIPLFQNADQINISIECYTFILAVTPDEKVFLQHATDAQYADFVNEHSKAGDMAVIVKPSGS